MLFLCWTWFRFRFRFRLHDCIMCGRVQLRGERGQQRVVEQGELSCVWCGVVESNLDVVVSNLDVSI